MTTPAPDITVEAEGPLPDDAIEALARLLLSVADQYDEQPTPRADSGIGDADSNTPQDGG